MRKTNKDTRDVIIQLLSNMGSSNEVRQYLKRFADQADMRFAVIKVGGAILRDEMTELASSLAFLYRVGLTPIVVHGGGPQLDTALEEAGIETTKLDGLRVTDGKTLKVARKVFQRENMAIVEELRRLNIPALSLPTGVFEADYLDRDRYGYVGEVERVNLDAVHHALSEGSIPVISSLGETHDGQILNINGDTATAELVKTVQPYKVIFLTSTGGLLDADDKIISTINLSTDYQRLMQEDWLHSGMRFKLKNIHDLLIDLPPSTSVALTKPEWLARELFTHKGSGTLVRLGEPISIHEGWDGLDLDKMRALIEEGFKRELNDDYFDKFPASHVHLAQSYRAVVVMREVAGIPYLDKFAVANNAQGEGLGRAAWQSMADHHPTFFLRSRVDNPVNSFYYEQTDGCIKNDKWFVFWKGIEDLDKVRECIDAARALPATVKDGNP
ncbi:MAG: acetylglutamate kinase [Sphingomonadales bacterium]|nr:acetylglutamate kinase [Sphingomonadales bacterium]